MKIRQITAEERKSISLPIQTYGFQPSPASESALEGLRDSQQYYDEHVTLVAEENGPAVADISAVPMRQNVRGMVCDMAGIAGLATLPDVRRRGIARALVTEILGMMRDRGCAVSTLYPFRPSYYERFGFVGFPKAPEVTFPPAGLTWLLGKDLPGSVQSGSLKEGQWRYLKDGYDAYLRFVSRLLAERHGFSLLPELRMQQIREAGDRWLAIARVDGVVAGAVLYRIAGFGQDLISDDLLASSSVGRALLLRFFAAHTDQVARITATIPPGEMPELWATDLEAVTEVRTSFPVSPAPMGRVLSLERLEGMTTGSARVTIEIVADTLLCGRYILDGRSGALEVRRGVPDDPDATLTAAGLSALVYGVLDPDDVVIRGFGEMRPEASAPLRALFPRRVPYLFARF